MEEQKTDSLNIKPEDAKADITNDQVLVGQTTGERPTSIISNKGKLEPLRPTKALLENHHIEVSHIVIFFGILLLLFIGMWKDGKKTKF
jgi:hypothetical protein